MFLNILQTFKEKQMHQSLRPASFLKKNQVQVLSSEIPEIFKITYFVKHLQTFASIQPITLLKILEAATCKCSVKKVFLKNFSILQLC